MEKLQRAWRRVILVRYGEIALKGKNRSDFEQQLARQIEATVTSLAQGQTGGSASVTEPMPVLAAVERTYGRIFVTPRRAEDLSLVLSALQYVPGLVSFSPAVRVPLGEPHGADSLPAIQDAAWELVQEALATEALPPTPWRLTGPPPRTFKVAARRSYKRFPLTSLELNQEVGAELLRRGIGLPVDVHQPDLTVSIEVREEGAYISVLEIPGPGGLPVGSSGRAVLLLSGGIDSPVAGWMALRRGVELTALHFESYPFTSEEALRKVEDLCRVMARYAGGRLVLRVCHFTEVQKAIQLRCPEQLRITILRRMMFRVAEQIAEQEGAAALCTGENIGQVASQTLESLRAIEMVTLLPVLRPLAGFDKDETVRQAQQLGTFDISIRPFEDCCTIFAPVHPRTRPQPEEVSKAEAALDVNGLVRQAVAQTDRREIAAYWPALAPNPPVPTRGQP
ncbi:MAG: tRNA 4-thiouridine(8) synthase ThiI [Limnochordaceae bacterium]|nr:tRNA 4-thiouridine(8) synthase ThiI [Limnochordaceae bacterium]